MWRNVSRLLVLVLIVMLASPAQAAELVHPISLYQEGVKVEGMIRSGEAPAQVLEALDRLAEMYARLDMRNISQRIEGINAVSGELVGLKMMYASVKGPDQPVAEFRVRRLVVAFDSLAYPQSPAWLPAARSMESHLEKIIEAVAKNDAKTAKAEFGKLRSERDRIWLALQLHGNPSDLNAQAAAHKLIEGQLGMEQVAEKQGTLDALGAYKGSLGHLTAGIQVVPDEPFLPRVTMTIDPLTYMGGSILLLLFALWRWMRKKKN